MEEFRPTWGALWGGRLAALAYADDVAVNVNSEEELSLFKKIEKETRLLSLWKF